MLSIKALPQSFCFLSPFRSTHERCIDPRDAALVAHVAGLVVERRGSLCFVHSDAPVLQWPVLFGVSVY